MAKNKFLNSSNDRHAAVTDGVFAIAMTILVLEIAVPAITDISSGVAINEYFINYLAPSVLIYFISFYIVYNFWENTIILFNFNKISYGILTLNMITMASVCLIPFATGFFFRFYKYASANLFFSVLILIISLMYILIFMLLIRNNFSEYFDKKSKVETVMHDSYGDGVEFPNLKLYMRGITLTLFYLLMSPVISSLLSIVLAFVSPIASVLSFLLTLILVFLIRTRRFAKDNFEGYDLTDDEMEFLGNIRKSIYGE